MPTAYGVTSWGFLRKPLSQILEDVGNTLKGSFGQNIDVSPEGPFGQLIADLAAPVDEEWQALEVVYDSMDPDGAGGPRLVNLCGITGTVPVDPTKSTDTVTAIGTAAAPVPAGTQFQVTGNGALFETVSDAIIAALAAWAQNTVQAVGDLRKNGGNVYKVVAIALDAMTAAVGAGPAGVGTTIIDNHVTWRFMGAGTAAVEIPCESVDYGAFVAAAGTLTGIVTPVSGLASISNAFDAEPGVAAETDAKLRQRREAELAASGEGGVDSLRADVLKVTGVTDAYVFENVGAVIDGDGLEAHSIEAAVLGGADADIAKVVFTKGGGIYTHGGVVNVVNDASGNPHTVRFSRPTEKDIYILVNLTKNANYPADGDNQVKQALVDFANGQIAELGEGYKVGDDVITTKLYAAIFDGVAGVVDVTKLWISLPPGPPVGAANIAIGSRELAKFDTGRIVVTSI